MTTTPALGDQAPDFTLPGTVDGERADYTLSAQRGHPIVLAFYPGDETLVCTKQLCSYQDDLSAFSDLGAELWGISSQDIDSHEAFQRNRKLSFPLLADEQNDGLRRLRARARHGQTARDLRDRRAGKVAWAHVSRGSA